MSPFSVVEDFDVFEKAALCGPVVEPALVIGQLGLEQMEEGLGHSVVPAVSFTAHALHEAVLGDPLSEAGAGILHAAIGQVNEDHQIQPAATDAQVGEVADPHLIGALRGEIALPPIRR